MLELAQRINDYESCELTDEETIELFQDLLNTGMIWHLQGFYHRAAADLIEQGLITEPS